MKTENERMKKLFYDIVVAPAKKHADLVSKGIDHRTAMELSWGKKETDDVYKTIAKITFQPFVPNPLNQ